MSGNKAVLGFLGGLAAGALLGVLFAPQSGKKTRQYLMRRGKDAREDLGELFEKGHEQWGKLRNKTADLASMTREEVEDFVRFMVKEMQGSGDEPSGTRKGATTNGGNGRSHSEESRRSASA